MLMKGKDTKNALSLAVALFLLQIINSKKLSASASGLSLPSYKAQQRCGVESCYEKCPPGSCCSWLGFCGTGRRYCAKEYCKTQCPPGRPLPLYAPGQCGVQAGGRKCPTGLCCSEDGWCGDTEYHCNPQRCQSQCRNLTSSSTDENRYGDEPECGRQGCYKECPPGSCCSIWGYCGTTEKYCGQDQCQSECPPRHPPPDASGQCGRKAGY